MSTSDEKQEQKIKEVIKMLQDGQTVQLTALDYLSLIEFVQNSDDETYRSFHRLACTVNKSLTLGFTPVYDIFLKPADTVQQLPDASLAASSKFDQVDLMSVAGAIRILESGLEFNDVRHTHSTDHHHYFLGNKHSGSPDVELRVSAVREEDTNFHIQERSIGSEDWDHVDTVTIDWSIDG